MAWKRSRVRTSLAPPILRTIGPDGMRNLYHMLSISALFAAVLGTLVVIYAPEARFVPFALSIVSNYAFSIGAFGRARVLTAARYGRELPVWDKVSFHTLGFAVIAMIVSVLTFYS